MIEQLFCTKSPPWTICSSTVFTLASCGEKGTQSCYLFWLHFSWVLRRMFTAAPYDSKWHNSSEYALIALFSSPSQRSQFRRLKFHSSWMPEITRWSGQYDGVLCCNLSSPSVLFVPVARKYQKKKKDNHLMNLACSLSTDQFIIWNTTKHLVLCLNMEPFQYLIYTFFLCFLSLICFWNI